LRKVFLYLYPIKEYTGFFLKGWQTFSKENPLPILNECIEKRYRQNGYEVIIAIYPDKEIFGIDIKPEDKVIETDVTFVEATGYYEDGKEKPNEEIKYPSEEDLFNKVDYVDEIVVGGYHYSDCVRRVAEYFHEQGINTLVDVELTDVFFGHYYRDDFNKEMYSPAIFKQRIVQELSRRAGEEIALKTFNSAYNSPVYKFEETIEKKSL